MVPSEPPTPHPDAHLWAQATAIQSVRSLVPVVLDFKSNVFPKWRTFFNIAVTTYTLEDHLTRATPSTDATWLRLDATLHRWLYGSMAMDIVDLVMPTSTAADAPAATAYTVWTAVHGLFNDNKNTRVVYLAEEFRNIKQEDRSVNEYLNMQKAAADALAEVGAPVSDSDLVTNVIKGLHERFDSVTDIAPLLTSFPTFLNFRNMLLLQEMKVAHRSPNTSASAFVAKAPAPPSTVGGGPPGAGGGQQWRPLAPPTHTTVATARTRARTRDTAPLVVLPPCPPPKTRGQAPSRCGPCSSPPSAMASSDLARALAPTPTSPLTMPVPPAPTVLPCTAPRPATTVSPRTALRHTALRDTVLRPPPRRNHGTPLPSHITSPT
jgi:hypothetical protein